MNLSASSISEHKNSISFRLPADIWNWFLHKRQHPDWLLIFDKFFYLLQNSPLHTQFWFCHKIKIVTENVTRHFGFSSRNRKRDRKCTRYFGFSSRNRKRDKKSRSPFRIFVPKSKTGQKVPLAISDFRPEIENGTENALAISDFRLEIENGTESVTRQLFYLTKSIVIL